MKVVYRRTERIFEKVTSIASAVMGNSITFILALCTVLFWLSNDTFFRQDIHYCIGDLILGITFLSLFIIQKSFNRFSASLHLKLNELVASHEPADNTLINIESKTEHELSKLSRGYAELAALSKSAEENKSE
jgi:low affinity Fe/Cu permease